MRKKQKTILLITGILIGSISQIITHFMKLPDFASGLLMGIGLG